MRFSKLASLLLALSAAACGKSVSNEGSAPTAVEANLDAENFSTTIDSDNAVMNDADVEQLNSGNGA